MNKTHLEYLANKIAVIHLRDKLFSINNRSNRSKNNLSFHAPNCKIALLGGMGRSIKYSPYLQEAFPKADATLISDGSVAIVTQGFLDTVFSTDSPWGVENTISQEINEFAQLDNFQAETFNETFARTHKNSTE